MSVCQPQWLDEVIASYAQDAHSQELITKFSSQPSAVPHYTLRDGLLRYKHHVWVGQDPALQNKLITAVHASTIGGHSGIAVTYRCLKQIFA